MKKAKLTILIATLLLGTMLFSACGGTVGNMDAYLNPDYVRSEYLYNDEDVVSELTGYGVTEIQGDLVVLANTEGLTTAYKVYNLAEKKVVASFTDTTLSYTVTLYKDVPAFVMASVKLEVEEGVDVETTYVLYDAQGKELTRTKYPPDAPMALNDSLMVYDYATYTVEANGSMEKKADIPESLIISNFFDANDNYIYARNSGVLAVYDTP